MWPWTSLRRQIVWLCVTIMVGLALALCILFFFLQRYEANRNAGRQARAIGAMFSTTIQGQIGQKQIECIANQAKGLIVSRRVSFLVIFGPDRKLLLAEPAEAAKFGDLSSWPKDEKAEVEVAFGGEKTLASFTSVRVGGKAIGGFWLSLRRETNGNAIERFLVFSLLVLIAIGGVGTALGSVLAEKHTRRINALADTLGSILRGEKVASHLVDGPEELQRLGRRINRVADHLVAANDSAASLKADLERQIQDHTRDIEKTKRELSDLANTDPLTGLTNRRGLEIEIERYLSLSRRHKQPLALIMMDLDNFKTYNDKCGHLSGDTVLRAVANALTGQARSSDVVSRWGGDEFCILIPAADPEGALAAAQRFVISVLEAMGDLSRTDVSAALGASAGVACYPDDGEEALELIAGADQALYRVKAEGGSKVRLASECRPVED